MPALKKIIKQRQKARKRKTWNKKEWKIDNNLLQQYKNDKNNDNNNNML